MSTTWTQSEIERRALVECGGTAVANIRAGHDEALRAWAAERGLFVSCERTSNSFWANPFQQDPALKDADRDDVCQKFRDVLQASPDMRKRLPELVGKILGCWCAPKRCHCHEIVALMTKIGLVPSRPYEAIPAELKDLPRWLMWRFVQVGERKTKVPFQRNGSKASSTNPATWCSFQEAVEARTQGFDGIGFVFSQADDICGIDLDHHKGADGQLDAFAVDILKRLDSYAEFSPSGEGIHIILRGDIPRGRKDSDRGLEAYPTGRYFTFTGRHVPGTPRTVKKRHDAVAKFYGEFFPEKQADLPKASGNDYPLKPTRATNLDDAALLAKARSAKDGAIFARLWAGDSGDYGGDESRADAGLLSRLRFWTGADKARSIALFGQSGLADTKWQRPDYQERTWASIDSGEVYDPLHCEVAQSDDEKLSEFDYANILESKLPPIRTCEGLWYVYGSGVWRQTSRAIFRPVAQAVLPQAIRTARRETELLKHLEGRFQADPEMFKGFYAFAGNDGVLINAANGVLEVHPDRIQLLPHSQDHNFTRQTAATYNPAASAPVYERILAEALPDADDQDLFRLCLGNFLLPSAKHEVTLVCHGEAGRGKSTLAEPIAQVLGKGLVARLSLSQICDPKSYSLPQLRFASLNLGTELAGTDIMESDNFTKIVSGESIDAREIYGKPGPMQSSCKLWFLANRLPRFKSGTEAELRRTRFLRFDYQPPVKDVSLKAKIEAEQEGVFVIMLRGLQALLERGEMPQGGEHSRAVHDRFRLSNDPVGSFVAQKCRLGFDQETDKDVLKDAYDEFVKSCQLPSGCSEWFFKGLCERYTDIKETKVRQGGDRVRRMRGIALQRESLEIDY